MAPYFTSEMAEISNQLWAVTSAVGAGLCFLVLVVIAAMYTHQGSRVHLDRVSFRLMLYSLLANTVFGIVSAIGGTLTGPSIGCGLSIFLLQLTLEMSSFLLFCIALNLQLVVVHGVRGKHLEKYYVAFSIVTALAITVPPYAAGQYGWDPLVKDCWYTNDNQQQRLAWQIGTQLIWTGLTVTGEVVTACTVTTYMLRVHFRQKNILSAATSSRSSGSTHPERKSRLRSGSSGSSLKPMSIHANTYANVVIRIALYPFASCVINLTSIVCVIHATSTNGIQNGNDYRILLLSDFLYGGRAVVYALLAATDPALVRAVRAFVAHHMNWQWGSSTTMRSHMGINTHSGTSRTRRESLSVQVELSTVVASDYTRGSPGACQTTDNKVRDVKAVREAVSFGSLRGELDEDAEVLSPTMDKAERGALEADVDADAPGEPPVRPSMPIAFELSSPISPLTQNMRQRREQAAREQAEEDEFMRII
ncbi:hypothetical protein PENSPDRAFT_689741 [Peniophora sp. CONT]|nr:hypothetical protein PENSPDRAFT_689741 [Peniophora sp. CONT]